MDTVHGVYTEMKTKSRPSKFEEVIHTNVTKRFTVNLKRDQISLTLLASTGATDV